MYKNNGDSYWENLEVLENTISQSKVDRDSTELPPSNEALLIYWFNSPSNGVLGIQW